jgi:hypothetical protein
MNRNDEGPSNPNGSQPELDFERADFGEAAAAEAGGPMLCAVCQIPISDQYFTVSSALVCNRCEALHRHAGPPGSPLLRFAGAAALGSLAAVVGCVLWMAVIELWEIELGLIAIAVGWLVGTAIVRGSRGVGGVAYQLLAVFLTYTAIVMTYVPMLMAEIDPQFRDGGDVQLEEQAGEDAFAGDAAVVSPGETLIVMMIAIPIAYALPFLTGFENLIGLLIIGFALYQAWKMTAKRELVWGGPFQVGAASNR